MTVRMHFQLEISGETATLYLFGAVRDEHTRSLTAACGALPAQVRTLRLDLHGVPRVTPMAAHVIRQLLRQWRTSRRGEFRLTSAHLRATCTPRDVAEIALGTAFGAAQVNEALVGTYL